MESLWVRNPQVPSEEPLRGAGASQRGIPSGSARMALALHALSMGRWEMGLPLHPPTPLGPAQGSAPAGGRGVIVRVTVLAASRPSSSR